MGGGKGRPRVPIKGADGRLLPLPRSLRVCTMSADFWGLPTAGGTATAYGLLTSALSEDPSLDVRTVPSHFPISPACCLTRCMHVSEPCTRHQLLKQCILSLHILFCSHPTLAAGMPVGRALGIRENDFVGSRVIPNSPTLSRRR